MRPPVAVSLIRGTHFHTLQNFFADRLTGSEITWRKNQKFGAKPNVSLSGFLSRIEKKFRKLKLISVKSRGLNAKALVIRRTRIVDLQLVSIFFVNYTIVHYFYQTPLASLSMKFVCDSYYLDRFLRYLRSKSNLSEIEMTMGIRFPMGMGIPRESHGNGN